MGRAEEAEPEPPALVAGAPFPAICISPDPHFNKGDAQP